MKKKICFGELGFNRTHGMRETRFYGVWRGIKDRCNNSNMKEYKNYGGRGIKCLWKTFEEFKNNMYESYQSHIKDFGIKDTSIERIDNNGNYCFKNCKWATKIEQNNNTRNNVFYEFNGKKQTLVNWSKEICINRLTLYNRLNRSHWSIEKAFTTPIV